MNTVGGKAILPADWEQKQVDIARDVLHDIPACARAEYRVNWMDDPLSASSMVPSLEIAFPEFGLDGGGMPALGIRLASAPSNKLVEGQRLRDHIRRSTENFLKKNGVSIDEDTANEKKLVVIG